MRVCAKLQSEIRSRKSVMCSDPQLGGWAPGVVRAPNWFEPVRSELYVSDEMLVRLAPYTAHHCHVVVTELLLIVTGVTVLLFFPD